MTEEKHNDVGLYIEADRKIEKIKADVSELIKSDLGLGHKMEIVLTEQRLLKERVEQGVAKTAYETLQRVNELFKSMEELGFSLREQKLVINTHQARIDSHAEDLRWIRRGIFGVVFLSIFLAFMQFLWRYRPPASNVVFREQKAEERETFKGS
jgi:hypothetical protein